MRTATSKDGTLIAYDRLGNGPAVVVVGGAFQHRHTRPELAALLSADFSVYTYDRRGRGDSGDTPPYAVAREVEDLAAVIAEAGGSAVAFGMSSGAVLALHAVASGVPISRLAIFEPPYRVAGPLTPPDEYLARLTQLLAAGDRGGAVALFMTDVVGQSPEAVAAARDTPMWPDLERLAHTIPYDHAVMGDSAVPTDVLAKVTVPVLVLDSQGSAPWLHAAAQAVTDALPHAQRRSLPGDFHSIANETLAPVLTEFFTR